MYTLSKNTQQWRKGEILWNWGIFVSSRIKRRNHTKITRNKMWHCCPPWTHPVQMSVMLHHSIALPQTITGKYWSKWRWGTPMPLSQTTNHNSQACKFWCLWWFFCFVLCTQSWLLDQRSEQYLMLYMVLYLVRETFACFGKHWAVH